MSKIGRMPIAIKEGVTVTIAGKNVSVTGGKGNVSYIIPEGIGAKVEEGRVLVSQDNPGEESTKALFGLVRATIANLITGVSAGFEKKLELAGVGFRAQTSGSELTLSVGFSHQVKFPAPNGIKFAVNEGVITVIGTDKALVGNTAAKIRAIRPPEPYKGKGIKYSGEKIRRKAGKAAKAVGGTAK